jgi:Protein of unknown function (DUF4197)
MQINRRNLSLSLLTSFGLSVNLGLGSQSIAQGLNAGEIISIINSVNNKNNSSIISNIDAQSGLKEALINGAIAAILKTGKQDGFWGDNLIKIPLPSKLQKLQSNLKIIGMSKPLDDLHLGLNRAAEAAVPLAKDVFVNAIKGLTINDALAILKGGDNAATNLLQINTKPQLVTLFRPNMVKAIDSTSAGLAINNVNKKYGTKLISMGLVRPNYDLKAQLIDYSVSKALDGLYLYIGKEEAAIRKDPAKRTSELLKKVFGGL